MKIPRRPVHPFFLLMLCLAMSPSRRADAASSIPTDITPKQIVSTEVEPIAPGLFQPTWKSLEQYQVPKWFTEAKFGIWAHWGPQCEAGDGDWYARYMYIEGSGQYKDHLAQYGPPSKSGFKDVIHEWKAENWNPEKLVALYKRAGAQYFFALADHHDNFDNWNSKYQPWNSVSIGPKKDIIGGWAKAARAQGLPFGVSVHAAHAWSWYEVTQGADKEGPYAGLSYDGKLTKADGKGTWWEGLDPQDLYAQNHTPSPNFQNGSLIHSRWNWGGGVSQPDLAYCQNFYNRVADLIKNYQPELIYFDDTALPLWPVSDAGLKIAADFYNANLKKTGGQSDGVLFGKILDDEQRKCLVWDIERGVPATGLPYAWQTDTCIGGWHYDRSIYDHNRYKNAATVVHMLADIVSKNGNLLLNIPVRGDGTIDEKEQKVVEDIASWMDLNRECIFGTHPWTVFGEGPASAGAALSSQGFNEGRGKPFTADDVRFTVGKDGSLYAISMGWPVKPLSITSLAQKAGQPSVASVKLLGSMEIVRWKQAGEALVIEPPQKRLTPDYTAVYKITLR